MVFLQWFCPVFIWLTEFIWFPERHSKERTDGVQTHYNVKDNANLDNISMKDFIFLIFFLSQIEIKNQLSLYLGKYI